MLRRKLANAPDRNGSKASLTALESRFAEAHPRLGPQRQQLVRSILENCEETCFLSSRELARRFAVDAATIVRTAQALGYKGFPDFANDLRKHFVTRITPYTVLKAATQENRSVTDHINHCLDKSLENLNTLNVEMDRNKVIELAKHIHKARRILVVGVDMAATLAYHFAYGLATLGFDAEAPIGSEGNLQHKVKILTSKDLMIAISFGQCLRVTVETVQRASKKGVPTFGITDSDTTPLAHNCDIHLVAAAASPSFLSSYAAPMALINVILVACAHLNPKRSLSQLKPTDKEYLSGSRWYREVKGSY